LSGNK